MRRLWRLLRSLWQPEWRGRYRCSCGKFSSNVIREARRHALGWEHWVWDYEAKVWVTNVKLR